MLNTLQLLFDGPKELQRRINRMKPVKRDKACAYLEEHRKDLYVAWSYGSCCISWRS
jgi:hypothetical protein